MQRAIALRSSDVTLTTTMTTTTMMNRSTKRNANNLALQQANKQTNK
jgi:hypothetical protein